VAGSYKRGNKSSAFGFQNMRGISWPAEQLLAFQERLCFMQLVHLLFALR
jgi:hypothetical protein